MEILGKFIARFTGRLSSPRGFNAEAIAPLPDVEVEFLSRLAGKRADDSTVLGWWCSLYSVDRAKTIDKLKRIGYLTLASHEAAIRKATIPTLKKVLETYSLPAKGKKIELVQRVIENISKDACLKHFPATYWALTQKAVDLLEAEAAKNREEYRKNIDLIRNGQIETLKRKMYPDIMNLPFAETIAAVMKQAFDGFGFPEEVRRNAASFVAMRAVNYSSREYSICGEEIADYLRSVNIAPETLNWPAPLTKYARESGHEGYEEILDVYIGFLANKARAAGEQARAENLGLNWYVWRTSGDSRVRPSHRIMDDVLVPYSDPPAPETLIGEPSQGQYHAGAALGCRCVQLPLLDSSDVAWPHKVYRGGLVQTMTLRQFRRLSPAGVPSRKE